ncbi:MAG: hypothetical protein CM1200mP39_15190 [Dehalococcoidia bacterium]|nr:MAG: hypothetical protein CM1200mP39_15190 [Dehalococcoidia bacterium]
MDFAFGGDGWLYVLNRFDTVNTDTYPKVRFAVCNLDDKFPRNIDPGLRSALVGKEASGIQLCFGFDKQAMYLQINERIRCHHEPRAGRFYGVGESREANPGKLDGASGITRLSDGTFWVVVQDLPVQHFTSEGCISEALERLVLKGQMSYPWGVAVDPIDDSIVVADWRNDRVQRFSPKVSYSRSG